MGMKAEAAANPILTSNSADSAIQMLNNRKLSSYEALQAGLAAGYINPNGVPQSVLAAGIAAHKIDPRFLLNHTFNPQLAPQDTSGSAGPDAATPGAQ